VRVVVLADTHIRPGRARRLPDVVYKELERADAIIHAGDFVDPWLVDELRGFAPLHAVLGNNDHFGGLPETEVVALDGVRVAIVHDSGPRVGRDGRMARRFPGAGVVVYGHSHAPDAHVGLDGQLLFNPGSPTERRAQPHHTYGVLVLQDGSVAHETFAIG
jgi:putative phosphoesterase